MRFTKSGKNWEGRGWKLAGGLSVLATQIETAWPDPEVGDGTVASKAHDAVNPTSDHRPFPYTVQTGAIVRALDAGETSETITQTIVDNIVKSKDPRLMYLIYEGKSIWSVTHNGKPPWTWQTYTGPNPHAGHFHISTKKTTAADSDTRPWDIGVDDMADPYLGFCELGDEGVPVLGLQTLLARQGWYKGTIDGVYGSSTAAAVLAMRKSQGSSATSGNTFSKDAFEQLMTAHVRWTVDHYGLKGEKGDPGPSPKSATFTY